jgi:hypothetical protein
MPRPSSARHLSNGVLLFHCAPLIDCIIQRENERVPTNARPASEIHRVKHSDDRLGSGISTPAKDEAPSRQIWRTRCHIPGRSLENLRCHPMSPLRPEYSPIRPPDAESIVQCLQSAHPQPHRMRTLSDTARRLRRSMPHRHSDRDARLSRAVPVAAARGGPPRRVRRRSGRSLEARTPGRPLHQSGSCGFRDHLDFQPTD